MSTETLISQIHNLFVEFFEFSFLPIIGLFTAFISTDAGSSVSSL